MAHNKGRRRQGQYSTSLCISGKLQVKNRNWCGEKKIITHLPKSLLKWSIKDNRHQVSNILYFTFAMLSICGKTWRNLNWGFNLCQIDETKNLNIFRKTYHLLNFIRFLLVYLSFEKARTRTNTMLYMKPEARLIKGTPSHPMGFQQSPIFWWLNFGPLGPYLLVKLVSLSLIGKNI